MPEEALTSFTPGFQRYVSVSVFGNRFRKNVSIMPFRSAVTVMPLPFWCHVHSISVNGRVELSTAQLAQWAGGRVSRASEWAELQAR